MSNENICPAGRFNARAVRVSGEDGDHLIRWGFAGENKTKQILMYFEISDGERAGERLPWFGFFTAKSAARTIESLRAMGFRGNDLMVAGEQALDEIVQITVEHHEHNEKTYARVAWVNRVGSGAIKLNNPMSDADLRAFAAQMKTHCARVPEIASAPPPNGSRSAPVENDDVPF